MTLFFAKRLVLVLAFGGVSACSSSMPFGGTKSRSNSDGNGRIIVSPPDSEVVTAKVLGNERLLGFINFEVLEGEPVATDETGAQLLLPAGIVAKGPSAGFRETADIPQETMEAVEFQLAFTGGVTENLVVMYRLLPVGDAAPVVGLIPLSYLKVDSERGTVSFKPRGLGDYQVAQTPERVVKPLTSTDPSGPSVGIGMSSNLQLLSSLALPGGFGLDVSTTHAFVVGDNGTQVVDISNAEVPRMAASNEQSGAGRGAQLVGNLLVQVTTGGQSILNVSTPNSPILRAAVSDAAANTDLVVISGAGFATNTQGIRSFVVSNNEMISQRDQVNQTGGCNAAAGDNRIAAFVCAATVMGFTTNTLPLGAAGFSIDNAVGGRGVAVSGSYVYVVGDDGLRIYDTTQVLQTRRVGALNFASGRAVVVSGDVALVVTATEARLVDVSNKAAPGFYSNAVVAINGGRRVRMIPGTKRAVILDDVGLKYVEIR